MAMENIGLVDRPKIPSVAFQLNQRCATFLALQAKFLA